MAYGQNILSTVPADWVVTNGELTSSTMTLHANGLALLNITIDMIDKLPETAEVTVVAGTYSINNRVEVIAVLQDNTYVAHTLPIVDVGNGIYKTIIDFPGEDYSSFVFKISSKEGVDITEWSMTTPVSADFTEVIDGVKQEIPKLLWDYNTLEFQIGQEECTVGMISAKLSKNGDLQGHLQINCTASEDSSVTIRIFDNDIQELYSPIEFVVKRGRNSLGIPHSYIGRKIGIHNFLVTMQVKTGTVTVETRGFLYTIDGGYLAQRILDVGYEVHDITIKQLPTDQDPSEIYAVCIDDGKALVRSRVYNEEYAIAWEPEYIIEDAVMACIEFHGLWILRDGEIGFTLETENVPHVMWIDSTGRLWDQKGPDVTTKFLMAEGVSYLSACMAYNYAPDIQYDQGIICAYIKGGQVFYKNLCRSDLIGGVLWSAERPIELLGSGNTQITVARLNDYRSAINAINSRSQWLISDRGYVGQSVRSESVYNTIMSGSITNVKQIAIVEHSVTTPTEVAINTVTLAAAAISMQDAGKVPFIPMMSSFIWANQSNVTVTMNCLLHGNNYADTFKCAINGSFVPGVVSISGNTINVQLAQPAPMLARLELNITNTGRVICYDATNTARLLPTMQLLLPSTMVNVSESVSNNIQLASVTNVNIISIKERVIDSHLEDCHTTVMHAIAGNINVVQIGTSPI